VDYQPLQELRLRDFRCFREQQMARLAPLTLLLGDNSTGKTSFLAALKAILEVASYHKDPDFRSAPYDLGSFREIAHRPQDSRHAGAESFSIGFECTGKTVESVEFDATFTLGKGASPTLATVTWSAAGVWIRDQHRDSNPCTELGCANGSWRLPAAGRGPDDNYIYGGGASTMAQYLRAAVESATAGELQPLTEDTDAILTDSDYHDFGKLYEEGALFRASAFAGGPTRSSPLRTYDPVMIVRDPEGSSVPAFLADAHARDSKQWHELKQRIEQFGHESGLFDEILVKRLGKHEYEPFQLEIRKWGKHGRRKGAKHNLIDVGYGVSQVLPLLLELLIEDGYPRFLLQQPEVHLHPSAQAALGSLFCSTAASGRQLIVETHSEYIIDRVRMDIRDRETGLKPEDVSILFFERADLAVHIHSLRFDEQGNLLDAPDGYGQFFMEETRRSIGL